MLGSGTIARFTALTVGLGMALFAAPASGETEGGTNPLPALGVQFQAAYSDYTDAQRIQVLDLLGQARVPWVRVDFGWRSLQEQGRGTISQWYVDLIDRMVDGARARGIKVLGLLYGTPDWANGNRGRAVPPNDPADYAWIAKWAATHWRGRVSAWQVWNEPNQGTFWSADAAAYVRLLKPAYPAFKSGDPDAEVVLGGPSYNDVSWLSAVYSAGAQGYFDVMATQPYMSPSDLAPETDNGSIWTISGVRGVRDLMVRYGDGAKPVWFTEFGWSSHPNSPGEENWNRGVSLATQADYLKRAARYVQANFPYVTNMFWYRDRNDATGDPQLDNFGLLYRDLSPKPAYHALRDLLTGSSTSVPDGGIAGTVKRQSPSRLLKWVSIRWTGSRSGSTSSGSTGSYRAEPLPPGTYSLTFVKKGCTTKTIERSVTAGTVLTTNVVLACR